MAFCELSKLLELTMEGPHIKVGATVWAEGTIITNGAEPHHCCGRHDITTFVSGIAGQGLTQGTPGTLAAME